MNESSRGAMMTMENGTAEQLWYTWSDVGLSAIHTSFRVRAASPGLTKIHSERVKSMDRHMRYVLPPGTDPFAITPEMAPVCLAFIRSDWNNEYILVHKNYAGEDGVGHPGNFFVHVIALGELSHYFSAEDAIWLWGSDIWKTSDKEKDRRSNDLETIPLKILQSEIDNFQPNFAQVRQYLPFIIEAYLSRKNRSPLYLAAHNSAMIAYLVAGLVNCLPRQLLTGLTFSTYEPDVTKATTEIVGTSWIVTPGTEIDAAQVFSPQFYQEKLAINCYTRERSSLQGHPHITHRPFAADFAAYATECLFTDNVDQLYAFRELAEKSRVLDVDLFLRMYYNEIANTDSIVEAEIDRDLADPYMCLDRLCNRNFRKRIIERAEKNRQWSENQLQPRLLALRGQAQRESAGRIQNKSGDISAQQEQISSSSLQGEQRRRRNNAATQKKKNQVTLAEALTFLAQRAIPDIVDAMKKVGAWRETVPGQSGADDIERQKKTETVATLLALMDCCLLPQNSFDIWKQLFDQIAMNQNGDATAFLITHWGIFPWLLKKWDNVFPVQPEYDNALRPLLIIPWNRLGEFLKIDLRQRHKQWNIIALESLNKDTTLTPQVAHELEQSSVKEINDLLGQLLQEPDLTIASSFAIRLIEKGCSVKPHASLIEKLLAQLIRDLRLWSEAKDLVVTLTLNGYMGTEPYLDLVETLLSSLLTHRQASIQEIDFELVNLLVEQRYPRKTKLIDLLLKSNIGQVNLESILAHVYRTPEELNAFFINHGSHYLSTPDQVRAMISLYKSLLQVLPHTQKLERLFVLLDAPQLAENATLDENTRVYLLDSTPLEGYESARILERYGKSYLETFQQTPQLANKVVEWFIHLVKSGYPERLKLLFILFTSATSDQLLEVLLSSAQLSLVEESREFFRRYGSLSRYFRFFYGSATALALFARFAQTANTLAGSGQAELAKEKMTLVLAWVDPSIQLRRNDEVEKILRAAYLTTPEQIRFLEHYGETYLSHYPKLPLLKDYTSTYINTFTADSLEQLETRNFFTFLTRVYQHLPLDDDTQRRVQCWIIIDNYLTSPNTRPEMLKNLARALYDLGLPNDEGFITKLAKAFVSCVRKSDDLYLIMQHMEQVPRIKNSIPQLLYIVAEQVAEQYQQPQNLRQLVPYLSFVPDIPQEQQGHFAKEFFDTLLYRIDVLNLDQWKTLDSLLTQQGLTHQAHDRWRNYFLNKTNYVPERMYHIFFCYAREDEQRLDQLKTHLQALQRQKLIDVWHDRNINAGKEWEQEINTHLNKADIILLLVSPDFMASEYCYSVEMVRAMERHERKEAVVIPVILRPVYWREAPFGKLQALPTNAKPIISSSWYSSDDAFFDVAEGIRKAVEEVKKRDKAHR